MGSRPALSWLLLLGAAVLLGAIYVGESMGAKVLGRIRTQPPPVAVTTVPVATAAPSGGYLSAAELHRRRGVLSVATDPAFPDPRVTPVPTPVPTQRPTPKPTPEPSLAPAATLGPDDAGGSPPPDTFATDEPSAGLEPTDEPTR